jgi:hypothetical protein
MKAPRRAFLGALVTAPLVPAAAAQGPASPAAEAAVSGSMVEGLLAAVRARFGHHLATDEVEAVRKEIESLLRAGERLHAVPLANSDEPVGVFEARPPGDRGASAR